MDNRTVSVVIPAHNSGRYLKRCIDSVLSQIVAADEVIIVDDGSTDDTANIIKSYGSRVAGIYKNCGGASSARNAGIAAAKGYWIAFLDADDQWLENHLSSCLELIANRPKLRWVCSNCIQADGDSQTPYDNPLRIKAIAADTQCGFDYLAGYAIGVRGHTDTMFIQKQLLAAAGLFSPLQKRINDDDMWLRIAYIEPYIGYIAEPTAVYYRDIPASITKRYLDTEPLETLIDRHLTIISAHPRRCDAVKCLSLILKNWCWSLLERGESAAVRRLIKKYRAILDDRFYRSTMAGSFIPRLYLRHQNRKQKRKAAAL